MRKKEEVNKELSQLDTKIAHMCFSGINGDNCQEYWDLKEKVADLKEELRFISYKLIGTNEEIDVYENPIERGIKKYYITLHDVPKEIGFVKVSYAPQAIQRRGQIGYELEQKYRGHNYTIKALEILREEMLSKGLERPTIAAYPYNIPSVRIIEKFGGRIIHKANHALDWNIYQVELKKKNKELVKK